MIAFVFVVAIAALYHLNRKVEERQIPIKQAMTACIQWADLIVHNPGETGELKEKDPWGVFLRKEVSDVSYRVVSAGPDKKFGNKDDISESRAITIVITGTPDEVPEVIDDSQDQADSSLIAEVKEVDSSG